MRDITPKPETWREAVAQAFVKLPPEAQALLQEGKVAKGDALEVARTAGILGAKRTWELIPFCHPIPLTNLQITYDFEADGVRLEAKAETIAATGVEMEALMAVNLAALTLYDMLKPQVSGIEIRSLRLISKRGGKSDYRQELSPPVKAAVIVLSDSVAAGKKEDRAGRAVWQALEREPSVEAGEYEILPDDPEKLQAQIRQLLVQGSDLIITVGGTGLAGTDRTIEALRPLIEREIPGIMEAARAYGQRRTLYAMLSRGLAGMIGNSLVLTFPGSTRGAQESYQALFPAVLHIFKVLRKIPHPQGYS